MQKREVCHAEGGDKAAEGSRAVWIDLSSSVLLECKSVKCCICMARFTISKAGLHILYSSYEALQAASLVARSRRRTEFGR